MSQKAKTETIGPVAGPGDEANEKGRQALKTPADKAPTTKPDKPARES